MAFRKSSKKVKTKSKTKTKTQSWYRKKAVEIAKKIAVLRDGGICQKCGKSKASGYQIHGSHIFSVGAHPTISAEPYNIKALCATCHSPGFKGSWHEDPAANIEWFEGKFPGRLKELLALEKKLLGTQNWEMILKDLKQKLKDVA